MRTKFPEKHFLLTDFDSLVSLVKKLKKDGIKSGEKIALEIKPSANCGSPPLPRNIYSIYYLSPHIPPSSSLFNIINNIKKHEVSPRNSEQTNLPATGMVFNETKVDKNLSISLTNKLDKLLIKEDRGKRTKRQIFQWAGLLKNFSKENDISHERMEALLIWLEKNMGKKFVPEVFSMFDFVDKFFRLENAMKEKSGSARPGPNSDLDEGGFYQNE